MRIRTTVAAVLVAAAGTFVLVGVAYAQPDERDCEDFSSQRQAQAVLDSPAGDPQRLDADRDGRACEIWFANRSDSEPTAGSADTADAPAESGGRAAPDPDSSAGPDGSADESAGPEGSAGRTTGSARQVSPVPRGGVDTGLMIARPIRSDSAPPAILLVAVVGVAITAAAGAAAAWVPARSRTPRPAPAAPSTPAAARPRTGIAA